ncbi:kinase-like protein [Thermothelomyces heterothallicus CBS 203.75]
MPIYGSTSSIEPESPGIVVKKPHQLGEEYFTKRFTNNFSVERQILERLGQHPRIVRYLGLQGDGILLSEASHGNLQEYLDEHHVSTPLDQRLLWCRQLTEALDYIHSRGVLHSDLRPGNILVHETTPGARDLLLADFGSSVYKELGLDGLSLPDGPFYNLFGIGSIFYTIYTGRWPYKLTPGRFDKVDDRLEEFATAKDALTALDKYLKARGKKCTELTAVTEKEKGRGDKLNDNVVGVEDGGDHYAGRSISLTRS